MELTKLGDYQIVRRIGQGGMGAVYEGLNASIGRRVAIKVLLPEFADNADVVRRFFNEAKAVNAINHPGVVQVSEVGTAPDSSLYLVMEFLDGPTLSERLTARKGCLPEEEGITIAWQLAAVLAAAHGKNILHRDLKPGNIMLVPDSAGPGGERVKLLDFGIAKLGAEHLQGDDVKSRTGQILGTAAYMSPEQFMGRQNIDCQTDVYSLGVVMFRMLAGRIPFISTNGEMALGMMHLNEPPPPLTEFAKDTSEWLVKLVDQMLAKSAAQRPTMAQVMSELQAHLPFRASSRSLPILTPNSGAYQSLKPLANQQGASQEQKPVAATPLGAAGQSSEPGAGTITRATGQRSLARGRRGAVLALGLVVLMLGGTGLYLRTQGRRPVPASGNATAASSAPAVSAPVANPPSPVKPGAAQGASGTPGGKARTAVESAATSADSSRRPGREKGSRLPPTTKPTERKNDDKPRRAPKSSPTPIID